MAQMLQKVSCAAFIRYISGRGLRSNSTVSDDLLRKLANIVGDGNISTAKIVREQHGRDESSHPMVAAEAVVRPDSAQQIAEVVKICSRHATPVIPFGAGSGFEGGVIPVKGGISIDVSRMNQVLEVNAEDFDVTVQPGVTRKSLNNYLRDTGLWFPVDPGADASIGGMAATSASGTNAVRYGTMREQVLNLQVVLPDGNIIYTAGEGMRARKTSAGYNLTNMFVGSEGTLGIFTKITLRLHAIPEMISAAVCGFPSVKAAVETAIQTLQSSIPVARVELLDDVAMRASNAFSKLAYEEVPTLFLEFHGSPTQVDEFAKAVRGIAANNGGSQFQWTRDTLERDRLWQARHKLFYAVLALRPGCRVLSTDVCVPISKLPDVIEETKQDILQCGIIGPILGHVGDGNFHAFILIDPNEPAELDTAHEIVDRLARRAWKVDGTCTGEHGIGLGKRHLLEKEIGTEGHNVMKLIKHTLDPHGIMNPGKIFI